MITPSGPVRVFTEMLTHRNLHDIQYLSVVLLVSFVHADTQLLTKRSVECIEAALRLSKTVGCSSVLLALLSVTVS